MGKRIVLLLCLAFGFVTVATWVWRISAPVSIAPTQRSWSRAPRASKEKAFDAAVAPEQMMAASQTAAPAQIVAAPQFGVGRGFYETDIAVELLCATPGAIIHYTTDGS